MPTSPLLHAQFLVLCRHGSITAIMPVLDGPDSFLYPFTTLTVFLSTCSMRCQRSCPLQLVIATACLVAFPSVALVDADVRNWFSWSFIFTGCTEIVLAGFMLPASLLFFLESRQRALFLSLGRSTNPNNLTNLSQASLISPCPTWRD